MVSAKPLKKFRDCFSTNNRTTFCKLPHTLCADSPQCAEEREEEEVVHVVQPDAVGSKHAMMVMPQYAGVTRVAVMCTCWLGPLALRAGLPRNAE